MALLQVENLTFRYPDAEKNGLEKCVVFGAAGELPFFAGFRAAENPRFKAREKGNLSLRRKAGKDCI